jgi:hypothetical protein
MVFQAYRPGCQWDWQVIADTAALSKPNVIVQLAANTTSYRFPLVIACDTNCKVPDMSVRFKTILGKEDQRAGFVWLHRDANGNPIVRANALEDNVALYKIENGKHVSVALKGIPAKT